MITEQRWKICDCLVGLQEIPDKSVDLVFTDPPYGIDAANYTRAGTQNGNSKAICKDYGLSDWDKNRISGDVFKEIFRVSKQQIIFGGNYYTDYLYPSSCWIVWDKDNGDNGYADCELAWCSFKLAIRKFKHKWHGMLQEDMKNKEERFHPTQKPLALFERILKKYTREEDLICDPFLGSGTTLEACMNLNRNCIGFEIDQQWEPIYRKRLRLDNAKLDVFNTSDNNYLTHAPVI